VEEPHGRSQVGLLGAEPDTGVLRVGAPGACCVTDPTTMKLTPELLAQAASGLNPNSERQLDLRGPYPPSTWSPRG
jgi:hypothetical protein